MRDSLARLRPGGSAVWIGFHCAQPGFDALALIRAEQRVLGAFAYVDRDFRAALSLTASLEVGSLATRSLEDGVEVFHGLLEGPGFATKTMLIP